MAVTVEDSGTQTATVTTEHTLETNAGDKTFVLIVDTVNMVNGDVLELRCKTKVLSGGTTRVAYMATYQNAQSADDMIKISIPIPSDEEFVATLKQTAGGAGRDFPWKVVSL